MGNPIVSGSRRTFRATLFGVVMLIFGGTALAATAPAVAPLYLADTYGNPLIDTYGNKIPYKVATGYAANKVAVDSNGNVYVTDAVSNTVSVFNTNGRLFREIAINKPSAVGVDDQNDRVYISGAFDGRIRSIYTFDKSGNGQGTLSQFAWENPSDITIGSSGDIYVADNGLNVVKRLSARGEREKKVFGPYGNQMNANEPVYNIKTGANETVSRTRHRMRIVQGIAVDEISGNLYIGAKEWIETLNTGCNSVSSAATGDSLGTSGTALICYDDTEESWKYYYDLCPNGNCTNNSVTNSTYKSWNPMDGGTYPYTTKYHILIIDIKERLSDGSDNPTYGTIKRDMILADQGGNEWYAFMARGLSIDGQGRLYVAGVGCDGLGIAACSTTPGKIKVYDVSVDIAQMAPTLLSSSSFVGGIYNSLAFSPDASTGAPKGRLFATIGDNKIVSAYAIDNATNPANTVPGKPILLEPVNSAAVNTPTPTLKIKNATDPQNDPLTYGYEIKDSDGNIVTSAAGIISGSNNETLMTVVQGLADSSYRWRVQSFDGELATWSDEGAFCVDYVNTNPTDPAATAPVNNAPVSSFASSLSWTASGDLDCSNDIVTYEVTISDVQGNVLKSFSGVASASINVSDISGLVSGNTYNWSVRAVDNKGGKSGYSLGSFTYMTTMVKFDSDPAGAKVYMGGNYGYSGKPFGDYDSSNKFISKTTPFEVQGITPGSHFITFINAGYEPFYAIVNIPDPLSADGKVTVVVNGKVTVADDGKVAALMVKASKIRPSSSGVELVKINGGSATPFVVDYNKDGFKDIIAGGKVNVYNESGDLVGVIDGKVYLSVAQEQLQEDGTKTVVLINSGALQADGVDINVGSRAVPFMADYDNDGNQDLLIGSGDGTVYLYKGSASGFVAAGTLALKDSNENNLVAFNLAPALVDYNSDGKKDLVVGSSDGIIRLYINTGSDDSPAFGAPAAIKADGGDLNVGSNSRAFFTDWNSDGKKDIVVGDDSGKASLFFNVGKDDSPEFLSIIGLQKWIKEKKKERGNREYVPYLGYNQDLGDLTGGSGEASPFVVDWNGTPARDIIVGNGSGGVAAYITE